MFFSWHFNSDVLIGEIKERNNKNWQKRGVLLFLTRECCWRSLVYPAWCSPFRTTVLCACSLMAHFNPISKVKPSATDGCCTLKPNIIGNVARPTWHDGMHGRQLLQSCHASASEWWLCRNRCLLRSSPLPKTMKMCILCLLVYGLRFGSPLHHKRPASSAEAHWAMSLG